MTTKILIFSFVLFVTDFLGYPQVNLNDLNKKINDAANSAKGGNKSLSNDDIVKGLKEALNVGTKNSTDAASKVDGYFKNPKIKIPFPQEVKDVETTVRNLGMNKEADKFVLTLNRAAEDAAKSAVPIFKDAVTGMTISDGMSILKGKDDAATTYLKNTSNNALIAKFKPIVRSSLQKVEVTKYWTPLANTYNKIPLNRKVNPDLDAYVTQKAIEGLFILVAAEELKIRKDPVARVTDILKKVFGN